MSKCSYEMALFNRGRKKGSKRERKESEKER